MRFRFVAVDSGGRIVRGVLRGDSEQDARESLLADDHFPKSLEAVADDEPVTWASRGRFRARQQAAAAESPRVVAETRLTSLIGVCEGEAVTLRLSSDGAFQVIAGAGVVAASIHVDRLELAAISGFPGRVLRLVTLDGISYDFHAGWVLAQRSARLLLQRLNEQRR
jgi:hypothetical protein